MNSDYRSTLVENEASEAAAGFPALSSEQAIANLARAVDEISATLGMSAVNARVGGMEANDAVLYNGAPIDTQVTVLPASVADVQSLIRIAGRCECRLVFKSESTMTCGRSSSLASRPRILVDLQRMNRVIAVDDVRACAIVEPGVSYFDLYEHLRAGSHDLMMTVPDEASVSVVSHVLYRNSHRRWRGSDVAETCGLEVVLSSGEVVRTGDVLSHYVDPSNHLAPDDSFEAFFSRGDLGIVTKIAVRLAHRPRRQIACSVRCVDEKSLRPLLNITRRLMADGVLSGDIVVTNLIATAARFSERTDWYKGNGPIPEPLLEKIIAETGLGRWEMRFTLAGSASVVRARLDDARNSYEGASGLHLTWHEYDGGAPGDAVREIDKIQAGIPPSFPTEQRQWYGAGSGQFEFTLAALPLAERTIESCKLIRSSLHEYRLDYHAQLQLLSGAIVQRCIVPFSVTIPGSQDWARAAVTATLELARAAGLIICRTDVEIPELMTCESSAALLGSLQKKVRLTIDPLRIFARERPGE
ncbi:hypothetical protein CIC12_20325 [Burkholderia sp. SG-MS1]|uniref:FAD-binding oxidoreductase n=1 Tax=Paraburkholderia sp. SG-MS1 TaxID=2023741 RepID=UPI0014472697|nr:FAD-dependent oxidoreductase [Paraburkholderia sp. SG-MS1]NKJ49039.1 hypothetical protein [Paraburkholderia sp. SG-MS1]